MSQIYVRPFVVAAIAVFVVGHVVAQEVPDGTNYTARATFDAKAKNVTVVVQNSGHRPVGQ